MQNVALIGIDLGKHSFHIHCQDKSGNALLRKKFTRTKLMQFLVTCPSSVVVMEACAGAHFMARRISDIGHDVKLISPQFVRPFVKSNKNDFIDAEAICEAASRPSMRFVQPRTETQQAMRALHRVRESLIRDKVKTTNQIHAFLLEFGISLPTGDVNCPGFPGECFICELRLPDHCFRWKHNKLFLLLPEEYGPAFPAIVDC
ncbi:IS110 family transposase, partial [Escherichia coli]|uniref:IS110 family transposase n=1 Tax=Escherichia coli TaxID=562 RepID=UPI002024DE8B